MSGKGVIITGGAKRLGAALARAFARDGCDIALHYNRSEKDARKLKTDIQKLGVECHIFAHDMADAKGIPALMQQIKKAMPGCAALINSASAFDPGIFMETDEALFDRQMDINFKAPFFLTQAFSRTFKKGNVVNIVDTDITKTQGSHFAYLLSKKALGEFTAMAARELGPAIRVNGVCPGNVQFPDEKEDALAQMLRGRAPLQSHARPEDVVEAVRWLMTQTRITGQLIYVDGGRHVA